MEAPLPKVNTESNESNTSSAKTEEYLQEMDYTLTSVFSSIVDLMRVNDRIAKAVEGLFKIERDRLKEENLAEGLDLEKERESNVSSEGILGDTKETPKMDWRKLRDSASGLGLAMATLAAGFVAFSDKIPLWLKRIMGIGDDYKERQKTSEDDVLENLKGKTDPIGPDFMYRAFDREEAELAFLTQREMEENKGNPKFTKEMAEHNARNRLYKGFTAYNAEGEKEFTSKYINPFSEDKIESDFEKYQETMEARERGAELEGDLGKEGAKNQLLKELEEHRSYKESIIKQYEKNEVAVPVELMRVIDKKETALITALKEVDPNVAIPTTNQISPPVKSTEAESQLNTIEAKSQVVPDKEPFDIKSMDEPNYAGIPKQINRSQTQQRNPAASEPLTIYIGGQSKDAAGNAGPVNIDNSSITNNNIVNGGGGSGMSNGRTVPPTVKGTKSPGSAGSTEVQDLVNGP